MGQAQKGGKDQFPWEKPGTTFQDTVPQIMETELGRVLKQLDSALKKTADGYYSCVRTCKNVGVGKIIRPRPETDFDFMIPFQKPKWGESDNSEYIYSKSGEAKEFQMSVVGFMPKVDLRAPVIRDWVQSRIGQLESRKDFDEYHSGRFALGYLASLLMNYSNSHEFEFKGVENVPLLGWRLPEGKKLIINGDAGELLGHELSGGKIEVKGHANVFPGAGMTAGSIYIDGNALGYADNKTLLPFGDVKSKTDKLLPFKEFDNYDGKVKLGIQQRLIQAQEQKKLEEAEQKRKNQQLHPEVPLSPPPTLIYARHEPLQDLSQQLDLAARQAVPLESLPNVASAGLIPTGDETSVDNVLSTLKVIAPSGASDLVQKTLQERRSRLSSSYPKNQEFTKFEVIPASEGGKSYLALMAGPNRDIPVLLKEGQTNPDFLSWAVDQINHGKSIRLNLDWDLKFNENCTKVTEATVTRLSVTLREELQTANVGNSDKTEVTTQVTTKKLYDTSGNLTDTIVLQKKMINSSSFDGFSPPEPHSDHSDDSGCEADA
jgi:hypothetical protein